MTLEDVPTEEDKVVPMCALVAQGPTLVQASASVIAVLQASA